MSGPAAESIYDVGPAAQLNVHAVIPMKDSLAAAASRLTRSANHLTEVAKVARIAG
jgi:hypothetical protein